MNPAIFFGLKLAGGYAKEKTRQAEEKRKQAREDLTEKRRQDAALNMFKLKTDYETMQQVKYNIDERERLQDERFSGGKAMGLDDKYARNYASLPDVQRDVVEQAYKDGQDVNSLFSISNKTGVGIGMETPDIKFNYQPKKEFDTLEEKINSNLVTLATHIEAGGTEDDEDYKRIKAIIDRQTDLMNSFVAPNNPYAKSALTTIDKAARAATIGAAGYSKFDPSGNYLGNIEAKIKGKQFDYLVAFDDYINVFETRTQQSANLPVVQNYIQSIKNSKQSFIDSQLKNIVFSQKEIDKARIINISIPESIKQIQSSEERNNKMDKYIMSYDWNSVIKNDGSKLGKNDIIKIGSVYGIWGGSISNSYTAGQSWKYRYVNN